MLLSMSSELEKTKVLLYDAKNKVKEKNSKIAGLDLKLTNVMVDMDSIRMDNIS